MTGTASNRPLSSHPAFRWAVGLWFAALLGAGLFVMPDTIHASIRQALGIDALLPGGLVGKAALAAGAGFLGFLLGIVLAMRVAALNGARAEDGDEDDYGEVAWQDHNMVAEPADDPLEDEPRRPFSPREYFGEEALLPQDDEVVIEEAGEEERFDAVELAEFEPVEEVTATEPEIDLPQAVEEPQAAPAVEVPAPAPASSDTGEAMGDLPLAALTDRLKRALDASRAAAADAAAPGGEELDPVIAFLRREADRAAPATASPAADDAQAALRSALDRLSQVGKQG